MACSFNRRRKEGFRGVRRSRRAFLGASDHDAVGSLLRFRIGAGVGSSVLPEGFRPRCARDSTIGASAAPLSRTARMGRTLIASHISQDGQPTADDWMWRCCAGPRTSRSDRGWHARPRSAKLSFPCAHSAWSQPDSRKAWSRGRATRSCLECHVNQQRSMTRVCAYSFDANRVCCSAEPASRRRGAREKFLRYNPLRPRFTDGEQSALKNQGETWERGCLPGRRLAF